MLDPDAPATLTLSLELSNLDVHWLDAYAHRFDVAVYAPDDAGAELTLLDADDEVLAEGWHGPGAWWVGLAPTCEASRCESTYRVVMATNTDIRVPVDWVASARSTIPLVTFGGSRPAPEVVLTWIEDP